MPPCDEFIPTGRIDSCRLVEVIQLEFVRGSGVGGDPLRRVTAWFSPQGELIHERDSWAVSKGE